MGMENIAPGTRGAARELAVATKFMMLGYEAFLNCSPHGLDLIVMDTEGVLSKVEVKSMNEYETRGYVRVPVKQRGTFDVIVGVNGDLEMFSYPQLPHFKPLYPTEKQGNYTTVPSISPVEAISRPNSPIVGVSTI